MRLESGHLQLVYSLRNRMYLISGAQWQGVKRHNFHCQFLFVVNIQLAVIIFRPKDGRIISRGSVSG